MRYDRKFSSYFSNKYSTKTLKNYTGKIAQIPPPPGIFTSVSKKSKFLEINGKIKKAPQKSVCNRNHFLHRK